MSVDGQSSNTRTDNTTTQQQLISPTSPSTPTEHTTPQTQQTQQRKIVYVPGAEIQQQNTATATAQYMNYPTAYPVQYYQNTVPNYPGYQDTTVAATGGAVPSNTAQHITATPQPGAAMMYQRGGNQFYVPVAAAGSAQTQQQMMVVSGGAAGQFINGQKWTDFYTRNNNKFSNKF